MRRRVRLWLAWLLAALFLLVAAPATAAPRLALVVGNAAYPARPLATSAADAGLVAQALAQAGFDVTAAMDLDGTRLRAVFHSFADAARDAGPEATIFVYLAGYGVQYDNDNYVVPVDAALAHDDDVPLQAVDLEDFARALAAAPAKARVLVYDLARATPFAADDEMPLAPGLALGAPPADTLVAFDAAPGMVAPAAPPYGAYARALAEGLGTADLAPARMFERVRLRVGTLTNGAQVPWTEGALDPGATLVPGAPTTGGASAVDTLSTGALSADAAYAAVIARDSLYNYADFLRAVPDGPLAARLRVLLAVRREATLWRSAATSDDPRAVWTYMRRYPRGPHLFDARRRLAALKAQLEPPPRFDPVVFPGLPAPAIGELALLAHPVAALSALPPIPAPPEALLPKADPAYGDDLPPPSPAPAGVLPIAAALPQAGDASPGEITQMPQGAPSAIVTTTSVAPGGAAALALVDRSGPLLTLATIMGRDGTRTILETGPKAKILSRTTTTRVGDAVTTVQTGGASGILVKISARAEPDGGRTVRVVDGADTLLAEWHRDAGGIVVSVEGAQEAHAPAAAAAPPVQPAPTSPTVAVPAAQAPAAVPASAPPRVSSAAPPPPIPAVPVPVRPTPAAPKAPAMIPLAAAPRLPANLPAAAPRPPVPASPPPAPVPDAALQTHPPPEAAPPSTAPLPPPRPFAAKSSAARAKGAPEKPAATRAQAARPQPAKSRPAAPPKAQPKAVAKAAAKPVAKPKTVAKTKPKAAPHRKR